MVETIMKYKKVTEELRHKLKRTPTANEIAKRMGISTKKARDVAQAAETQPTSLETPIGEEDRGQFLELIEDESATPPDAMLSEVFQHEHIRRLLDKLDPRDRKVLVMRFGLEKNVPLTLQHIAKHFKITKERVRQVEERAIKKLKELIVEEGVRQGISEDEVIK
jgi:RNA polymerase primary sigma factor